MAKKENRIGIILTSEESGYSYHSKKNKRNSTERIRIKKYDPKLRKHVFFKEEK
mgnify:CR=1 FL=1